jgi:uncharacterized protein YoxC
MIDVSDVSDSAVARHLSTLSGDIEGLKNDVSQLKVDVSQLKTDVQQLRTDMRTGFEMVVKAIHDMGNELRRELRAEITQLRADTGRMIAASAETLRAEIMADTGRMIAASAESLRGEMRVLHEASDARWMASQAQLAAHIADPHAHGR